MRNIAKYTMVAGVLLSSAAMATEELGIYSAGGGGYLRVITKNISADHDKTGVCNTDGIVEGSPFTLWIDAKKFPLAGGAGPASAGKRLIVGPVTYTACSTTTKDVKVKTTKAVTMTGLMGTFVLHVEGNDDVGSFSADCHEVDKPKNPTSVPVGPGKKTENTIKDQDGRELKMESSVVNNGTNYVYTYEVTNPYEADLQFSWPAVRTGDHASGWSGTVEAQSTAVHTFTGSGPAVFVPGVSTPFVGVDENSVPVEVAYLNTPAWCPSAYVAEPAAVASLGYTNAPASVSLSWLNSATYDEIQIIRTQTAVPDARHSWAIAGGVTSFMDDDAPSGEVTYRVVGVVDQVGHGESPAVTFTRD